MGYLLIHQEVGVNHMIYRESVSKKIPYSYLKTYLTPLPADWDTHLRLPQSTECSRMCGMP